MLTRTIAIVPAAGLGKRFDPSYRKTFANLKGVPLLIYALKTIHREDSINEIVPVLRAEDIDAGKKMFKEYHLNKIKRIAPGGKERQDSIYNALRLIEDEGPSAAQNDLVLIHDGVRPVIPEGLIAKLLAGVRDADGVIPAIPVKDTIKEVDPHGMVISTLNRENVRAVQTPQVFTFGVIKRAYDRAYDDGFYATDDAALVERIGGRIKIIDGSPLNIKVTTPEDLEMVEYIFNKEKY